MKKQEENHIVFLKGKKTILRPLLERDIPLLLRWVNDPEIRQFITRVFPAMENDEKEWLERLHRHSDKEVVLIMETLGHTPIGTMGIHGIDWRNRVATTGALIGEKSFWGKGYGTDAKMILLDYALNRLNLRKIMSRVYAFNKRSLAYSLHCGYRIEGRLKESVFINGRYWDEYILGLFKRWWLPYWEKYRK
jgi:RimJ/RimL family protein N-acetyltransferase